uniref:Diaminopimelate epimerase n=1 Tax=Plectus sambesii TaxID=2011161 RepID=A0A914XPS8_9BILA
MHTLGNDFVILDGPLAIKKARIAALAHRHTGIGFDQLIVIEPSYSSITLSVQWDCVVVKIFNADGTQAEQCCNALISVARYLAERKTATNELILTTIGGQARAEVIRSNFPVSRIMLRLPSTNVERPVEASVNGRTIQIHKIDMGNPHAIVWGRAELSVYEQLECSREIVEQKDEMGVSLFPQGANVAFVRALDRRTVISRVVERGVGKTFACGSSACATVVSGCALGALDPAGVRVCFELGHLELKLTSNEVEFSGQASFVFDGSFVI